MDKKNLSIILIAHNQFQQIQLSLNSLNSQIVSTNYAYEIIIVDDGSTDEMQNFNPPARSFCRVIHQNNAGRAIARNRGAEIADGDLLIFCDGDRIPRYDFVQNHLNSHMAGFDITIGSAYDYYGNIKNFNALPLDWDKIHRYSRMLPFYRQTQEIFNSDGSTSSDIAWISFLSGNASISRDLFLTLNGFDKRYTQWGFEHMDFALGAFQQGATFGLSKNAINYHIPHKRVANFYQDNIHKSCVEFKNKYPNIKIELLEAVILGEMTLKDAENNIMINM